MHYDTSQSNQVQIDQEKVLFENEFDDINDLPVGKDGMYAVANDKPYVSLAGSWVQLSTGSAGGAGGGLPSGGTSGQFLQTDGAGGLSWAAPSTRNLSDLGDVAYNASTIQDHDVVKFNGTDFTVGSLALGRLTDVSLPDPFVDGQYLVYSDNSWTSSVLKLPLTDGSAGQVLMTDGTGNLNFATVPGFEFSSSIIPTEDLLEIGSTDSPLGLLNTLQVKASQFININKTIINGTSTTTFFNLPSYTFNFPGTVGTNGQLLMTKGDGTTEWVNPSGGGAIALSDVTDVTISSATSGQILKYNGSGWENGDTEVIATALSDVTDVTISSATSGQILKYNGSEWQNEDIEVIAASYTLKDSMFSLGWAVDGPGIDNSSPNDNPTITVFRGLTYKFIKSYSGEPLDIMGPLPSQSVFEKGVTKTTDNLTWSVPFDNTLDNTYQLIVSGNPNRSVTIIIGRELPTTTNGTSVQVLQTYGGATSWTDTPSLQSIRASTSAGLRIKEFNDRIVAKFNGVYSSSYLKFHDTAGNNGSVLISANPNVVPSTSDIVFYLPTTNGTSGQVLQTDGAGATSWVDVSGGGGASTLVALTDTDLPAVSDSPSPSPSTGQLSPTGTTVYPKYPVAWNPNTNKFEIAYGIESGYLERDSFSSTPGGTFESIFLGRHSAAYGANSVCIGNGHVSHQSTQSIAIGGGNIGRQTGGSIGFSYQVADYTACFDAAHSIAIGCQATVRKAYSICIGHQCLSNGQHATIIGDQCQTSKSGAIALGYKAQAVQDNQIIINASNSTALSGGSNSNSLYINPIRNDVSAVTNSVLKYDDSTKEITHSTLLGDLSAPPASASDTGTKGEMRADANYIYVCVATNTWKRASLSTWP